MDASDIVIWVLRAIGVMYFVGGLFGIRQAVFSLRAEPMMDSMLDIMDRMSADNEGKAAPPERVTDNGRNLWLLAGAVLLAIAGIAMALGHVSALWLLVALVVQQMLYFIRQHRRARAAPNEDQASEIRPQRSTVNGFYGSLAATLLAAWLYFNGALWA